MNILCIGGGPAGLYFAMLMKKQHPEHHITVVERNRPYDTFGWGVVFSDQTLGNLVKADEETARSILQAFNHWDDIDTHFKGQVITSGGHGFCGIGRKRLLNILQERCESLGVRLVFETDVIDDQALAAHVDRGEYLGPRVLADVYRRAHDRALALRLARQVEVVGSDANEHGTVSSRGS